MAIFLGSMVVVVWYIVLGVCGLLAFIAWRFSLNLGPIGSPNNNNIFHDLAGSPLIIAHRGASLEAPENTLGAFKNARKNGAKAVEFDVDFTKDGVAVVIHDATVDRTTNGKGKVGDFVLEDIKKLNASTKHQLRDRFPGETVPTLIETIETCVGLDIHMMVEIKKGDNAKEIARLMKELFSKYVLHDRAAVTSYFPGVLYQVKKADPRIRTGLVWWKEAGSCILLGQDPIPFLNSTLGPILDATWTKVLPFVFSWLGISYFIADNEHICKSEVLKWESRNVCVCVYTVNKPVDGAYFRQSLQCPTITDTILAHISERPKLDGLPTLEN